MLTATERDGKRNVTKIIISMGVVGAIIFATAAYFLWSWTSKYSGISRIFRYLSYNFYNNKKYVCVSVYLFIYSFDYVFGIIIEISKKENRKDVGVEHKANPSRKPKCKSYWKCETSQNRGPSFI